MRDIADLKFKEVIVPQPPKKTYTDTPENWRKLSSEKGRIEREAEEDYDVTDPHYSFMLERAREQNRDDKTSPYHTMTLEDFVKSEQEAHIKLEVQFVADALNLPPLNEGHDLDRKLTAKSSLIMSEYVNAVIQDKGKLK